MPLHAEVPSQTTLQSVPPHVTAGPQELEPWQWIWHADACEQSTPPAHATNPQSTWQGMPGGQVTRLGQAFDAVQSITQVLP
jgi:hypothetical protein